MEEFANNNGDYSYLNYSNATNYLFNITESSDEINRSELEWIIPTTIIGFLFLLTACCGGIILFQSFFYLAQQNTNNADENFNEQQTDPCSEINLELP